MKELSIEEKAKAYDDAIERAKRMFSEKELNYLFPKLSESDDEKIISAIRKAIEVKVENLGNGVTRTACLDWLEKQCEKPKGKLAVDAINEEKVDNQNYVKPSVKGEPKFKVSDYVVDNCGYVWRIEGIINKFYILEGIDGGESRPTIEWVNKTFHLWDITEDAKNGDVLASKDEKDILIFRRIEPSTSFSSYYNIKRRGNYGWCDRYFIPATKEQRDQLGKVMADAGYVFDFEKKELKEIEHKPTWSEEDESNFKMLIDVIKENKHHATDYEHMTYYKLLSWFKSLKDRYTWKPSDEQMKVCKEVYADLLSAKGFDVGTINSELNRLEEKLKK